MLFRRIKLNRASIWIVIFCLASAACTEIEYYPETEFESTKVRVSSKSKFSLKEMTISSYISCNYGLGQTLNEYGICWISGTDSLPVYRPASNIATSLLNVRPNDVGVDADGDSVTDFIGAVEERTADNALRDSVVVHVVRDTLYSVRPYLILNDVNIVYGEVEVVNE